MGKEIPPECKNPLSPEEIAEDTVNCFREGACEVHLHTRDLEGNQTFDLDVFSDTIRLIRKETDMIIQGSTGGLSSLTLAERCVCLQVPEVEVASLNMGSVNFGETVYINTLPDIRYWAAEMEKLLEEGVNAIGLGPQGFGGSSSVLGVNIVNTPRHPATLGVAVNFGCWAHRRGAIVFDRDLGFRSTTHSGFKG